MHSEDEGPECKFTEVPAVTVMYARARRMYRQALNDAEREMKSPDEDEPREQHKRESEKGGHTMARETAARSSMREGARRRAEEQTHGGGGFSVRLPEGVKFFQNEGKTVELDFIPYRISSDRNPDVIAGRYAVGDLVDGRFYWMHRDVGAEQKPYVCLKSVGQRCPICEAHAQAKKNASMSKEEVDALRAKERVLYNVIDANDKEGKVMVWDVSYHMFTKLLESDQRDREERYDYADPEHGMTLRIRFEKMPRFDKAWEAVRIDYDPRKPLSEADMKAAVDLDACLTVLPYDKLEAVFLGEESVPEASDRGADRREPAGDRGRREALAAESRREPAAGERGRRDTAAPAADAGRSRGCAADTIHDKSPEAPGERERATAGLEPYRGELDEGKGKDKCPGGGRWGVDEGTLGDACQKCDEDVWKSCRDEKDRRAREDRAGRTQAGEAGGGRRR